MISNSNKDLSTKIESSRKRQKIHVLMKRLYSQSRGSGNQNQTVSLYVNKVNVLDLD